MCDSLTGLVAQQQTVGGHCRSHLLMLQSFTDLTGGACNIGEQPIKGLLDPKAMARLAVGEALTNLVWVMVTALSGVKVIVVTRCMLPSLKEKGQRCMMLAIALSEAVIELGIAIDGGKDGLSMASHADDVKPKVAVIREEGSNGDSKMSAAFYAAGFEPWDVTVSDLLAGGITLDQFRGIVFVGGFSYADVLDSTKGSITFNSPLLSQFQEFYKRPDTFSLGICDGCHLMSLLGWVPGTQVGGSLDTSQPRFVHNESGRTQPSIMLKGMEGSTLGVWAAHGEGSAYFPDQGVLDHMLHSDLAPLR
ncbi:hypothetical protein Bca52824_024846 [Brassica carinata]|uniref:FGAR-AT PurM N-terminal-like domain-containing protein n=1 Tax=Brassica carinata TaxID=52824 RepID=A0A8X7VKT1_BRACI|nr:hypothetical protein Bca52824_024846 [Brassica carinata]